MIMNRLSTGTGSVRKQKPLNQPLFGEFSDPWENWKSDQIPKFPKITGKNRFERAALLALEEAGIRLTESFDNEQGANIIYATTSGNRVLSKVYYRGVENLTEEAIIQGIEMLAALRRK